MTEPLYATGTQEYGLYEVRLLRNRLLAESDWIVIKEREEGGEEGWREKGSELKSSDCAPLCECDVRGDGRGRGGQQRRRGGRGGRHA